MRPSLSQLVAILLLGFLHGVYAAPHDGDTFHLRQPDGSSVPVRVWGDEFHQHVESLEGQTLVRDPKTNWIHFADLDSSGDLIPSKTRYGIGKRSPHSRKGLRADRAHVQKARQVSQRALGFDLLQDEEPWSAPSASASTDDMFPAPAEPRRVMGLTLLVNFPDQKSTFTRQDVDNFCNQVGYNANGNQGSIYDYFKDVSNGWLLYNNIVTAWVTVDSNKAYYDKGPGYGPIQEFITNALTKLQQQSGLDLSGLTIENNRAIALNIFYAGSATAGWAAGLWAHQGSYTGTTSVQGVRFSRYQMAGIGTGMGIGTFVHENGHMVMRWDDLYSYESPAHSNGVGRFCIMSTVNATNPQQPNPYFRQLAGWINVEDITGRAMGTSYSHEANSHTAFSYVRNTKEYYLIEARRRVGRSSGLAAEGLAVWHVHKDGDNTRNTVGFPLLALIQADGSRHLENKVNTGDSYDLFRANLNARFHATTSPSAKWHDGKNAGIDLAEISAVAPTMTFKIGPMAMVITYQLTVVGGQGGGAYSPAQTVLISAPDSSSNGRFLRWTSSTVNIADPNSSATNVVMANTNATVTANYQFPQVLPGALSVKNAGYKEAVSVSADVGTLTESSKLEWVVRILESGNYRIHWTTEAGTSGMATLRSLDSDQDMDTLQVQGEGDKVTSLSAGTYLWRLTGISGTVHLRELKIERVWSLVVDGGSGSGYFAEGEIVSAVATDASKFFRWHSAGLELQNPYEDALQISMPASDFSLRAISSIPLDVPSRIQAEAYHYNAESGGSSILTGQEDQGLRLGEGQGVVAYKLTAVPFVATIKVRAKSLQGASLILHDFNGWSDTLQVASGSSWAVLNVGNQAILGGVSNFEVQVLQGDLDLDWIDFEEAALRISGASDDGSLFLRQVFGGLVYSIPRESRVVIRMSDVQGHLVRTWDLGQQGAGSHTQALDAGICPMPGVYWIQMRAGTATSSLRMVYLPN